jgi:hypothetical protein
LLPFDQIHQASHYSYKRKYSEKEDCYGCLL